MYLSILILIASCVNARYLQVDSPTSHTPKIGYTYVDPVHNTSKTLRFQVITPIEGSTPSPSPIILDPSIVTDGSTPSPSPIIDDSIPTPSPIIDDFIPTPSPVIEDSIPTPSPVIEDSIPTPSPIIDYLTPTPSPIENPPDTIIINPTPPVVDPALSKEIHSIHSLMIVTFIILFLSCFILIIKLIYSRYYS
jgi:hypothetical protein